MKKIILSTPDRGNFAGYIHTSPCEKAALCIVHGVGEHFTRYEEFASFIAPRGYSVYGMDLFGHGESPGSRGYIGSRSDTAQQIDALTDFALSSGKPCFLMGHSMGGLLVLYYRHTHEHAPITGYAVSSPWLGLNFSFSQGELDAMSEALSKDPLAVHNTGINPSQLFTCEPGRVIERDKLMHPYISIRNNFERLDDIDTVLNCAGEPRPPLYIFAGADDPICNVSRMADYAQREHCPIDIWPEMKHEPWNEPDRELVIKKLADNLDLMLS